MYEGIDLNLYRSEGFLKYDYIIKEGSDPNQIRIRYRGVNQPKIKEGQLIIKHQLGHLIEDKPYAYQKINGEVLEVPCNYAWFENGNLGFEFPESFDSNYELVIDPVLIFSTYSGSGAGNFGMTATYDSLGNGYMGGVIFSNGYDTTLGAFQRSFSGGVSDITISKFSSDGTQLIYGTYIGGNSSETVHSMVVDNSMNLIIYGVSASSNFPVTSNAYDTTKENSARILLNVLSEDFVSGPDIIVTKFNESGTAILGSTFFGGNDADGLNINKGNLGSINTELIYNYGDQFRGEVIVDSIGDIFIGSTTYSDSIGNSTDTVIGVQDGIVAKFSSDLSSLIWSKYIGGSAYDAVYSLKLLPNGNLVAGGGTNSFGDFPTTLNSYQDTSVLPNARADGFICILSSDGSTLVKSTLISTPNYDQVFFVETDRFGGVYAFGQSQGGLFPTKNSKIIDSLAGQFIIKLDPNLDSLVYATTFGDGGTGGRLNIAPTAFLVDQCQNAYASGWGGSFGGGGSKTLTNNMPLTANAFRSNTVGRDFYMYVMERNADSLLYASFFGGTSSGDHVDGGTSRFDKTGVIYQSVCASCSYDPNPFTIIDDTLSDFPTTIDSYSPRKFVNRGSSRCNNALFKFDFEILPKAIISSSKTVVCAPDLVRIREFSLNASEVVWDFYGTITRTKNLDTTITFSIPGFYKISLIASDTICNSSDLSLIHI